MNQRKLEKEFRENVTAISEFMQENKLHLYQYRMDQVANNEHESDRNMFGAFYMSWRRSRCAICDELISIGDYAINSQWSFFGSYARSKEFHVACFYKQLKSDLFHIKNWIKATHYMITQEDYNKNTDMDLNLEMNFQ